MKSILITGVSSGVGNALAIHLSKAGHQVYGCVRKNEDFDALLDLKIKNLQPVFLDVTSTESIEEAKNNLPSSLDVLVNNAGISCGGPLEMNTLENIYDVFEVNVIGLMLLTKAIIPLLENTKGRIINIGSTANYMSLPGISVYSASKYAVRSFTDAMRRELAPLGIDVVLAALGAVESELWNKAVIAKEKQIKDNPELVDKYKKLVLYGKKISTEMKRMPTEEAAKIIEKAVTDEKPKHVYLVGKDVKLVKKLSKLPSKLLDKIIIKRINEGKL